jgi:dipeptidyl-peptidase-4
VLVYVYGEPAGQTVLDDWGSGQALFHRVVADLGYRTCAPSNYAEGLRGDLLIITGSGESNTHIEITEGLVDRLIALGKRFDYFVYPNRDHGLSEGKGSLAHVRMLIARYLVEHLRPGPL